MPLIMPISSLAILILLLFGGCGDAKKAEVYEVAKEQAPSPPQASGGMPEAPFAANEGAPDSGGDMASRRLPEEALNPSADNPDWQVPDAWEPTQGSEMRRASFQATGPGGPVDIAVTSFPGDVGGLVANLNRWRRQIGLPPLDPANVDSVVERQSVAGKEVILSRMEGTTQGTQAAIFRHEGNSWFFKMTGPRASVETNTKSFTSFISSVRFP